MDFRNTLKMNPQAAPEAIVQGEHYRFTILTERIVRMEYSRDGIFTDQATQTVIDRHFPVPQFSVRETEEEMLIRTEYLLIRYDRRPFSRGGLTVQMFRNPSLKKINTWFYGDAEVLHAANLKGTASTLDNAVGAVYYKNSNDEEKVIGEPDHPVEMCDGIMSRDGYCVIDDSRSLLFTKDGWVTPAPEGHTDIYFAVYGKDYIGWLKDYFHLTGHTPLLPRFLLGNWWSRYYSYTQEEYMALQDRFRTEGIPIAVAVLDMGWHITKIDMKYGSDRAWTGYTWDTGLFPDHVGMLKELHRRGMHVSLNVHPADGVRAFEAAYPKMAEALGADKDSEEPIPFDVTDPKFMDAYFRILHHPLEDEGVDFWWIDWQQGSNSRHPGYDPLWMLNHYHYMDNARRGKRPLTFSRYAGLGSHRYPIGFSGSTFICWESLDFQPWFTATASNVGYGWWSHDIGGHRNGSRDDELTARWVQFGVFSPIMRLHSSNEVFTGKEPWKFCADTERVMRRFLTLRHQLIPYLYTMNHRFHTEDIPLIQPMYYLHPDVEEAYQAKNEYWFGSEMIVSPITEKMDPVLGAGRTRAWIPEGVWYDLFTGMAYDGWRTMYLYRTLDSIPVLVRAGAVLPLQAEEEVSSRVDNPEKIELCAFAGADGEFEMYEDDGETMVYASGHVVTTRYQMQWHAEAKALIIHPAMGDLSLIPKKRTYRIRLYGLQAKDIVSVRMGDIELPIGAQEDKARNIVTLDALEAPVTEKVEIVIRKDACPAQNPVLPAAYEIINQAQIPFMTKEKLYKRLQMGGPLPALLSDVRAMTMHEGVKEMVEEILLARVL